MKEIKIDQATENQRLDKFLNKYFKEAGNSFIYKMLRKKNITLNNKKATGAEKLVAGDCIKVFFSDETFEKMRGESTSSNEFDLFKGISSDIDIIFEDEDKIIINKPAGILSQKAAESDISINEMAIAYMIKSGQLNASDYAIFHPSVVNRLDRNTSGIVLFAKNLKSAQYLSKALRERSCKKIYHALVKGQLTQKAQIDGYLLKDEATNRVTILDHETASAKAISTEYEPLKVLDDMTYLSIHLITGRTHQIRAHLASVGHPLLGDSKYGDISFNKNHKARTQALHAYSITFEDGSTYVAPEPEYFKKYI